MWSSTWLKAPQIRVDTPVVDTPVVGIPGFWVRPSRMNSVMLLILSISSFWAVISTWLIWKNHNISEWWYFKFDRKYLIVSLAQVPGTGRAIPFTYLLYFTDSCKEEWEEFKPLLIHIDLNISWQYITNTTIKGRYFFLWILSCS